MGKKLNNILGGMVEKRFQNAWNISEIPYYALNLVRGAREDIYIYIYIERERERELFFKCIVWKAWTQKLRRAQTSRWEFVFCFQRSRRVQGKSTIHLTTAKTAIITDKEDI